MKFYFSKVIAGTVLFSFAVAQAVPSGYANRPEVPFAPNKTLEIPAEFGRVTETVSAQPLSPLLIHIQVAHGNYEAEKNIKKILDYLAGKSLAGLLLLEGAANKLQPEMFRFFPDHPESNRKVTDMLMKEGYLTGPETFLLESQTNSEGWGVEDLDAYKTDRKAFISVVRSEKAAQRYLRELRAAIDRHFASSISQDLAGVVRQLESFDSGTLPVEVWIRILAEESLNRLKMDLGDAYYQNEWPLLVRYQRLQAIGSGIDRASARQEAESFIEELESRNISEEITARFRTILRMDESVLFRTSGGSGADGPRTAGYSSLRHAFDLLLGKLPKDFSMDSWPRWIRYAQYVILMQEMDGQGLQKEMARLGDRVLESLAGTVEEKEYVGLARVRQLLKKAFRLELSREEYRDMESRIPALENFFEKLCAGPQKQAYGSWISGLQAVLAEAMHFYGIAVERENRMFRNALTRMAERKAKQAVLITGGFHSEGLKKLAALEGCSYLQITPRITEVSKRDRGLYLRSILGPRKSETSQMSAVLAQDRAAMETVLGRSAENWLENIRLEIRRMISAGDFPDRQALLATLARAPLFADFRSEMREGGPSSPGAAEERQPPAAASPGALKTDSSKSLAESLSTRMILRLAGSLTISGAVTMLPLGLLPALPWWVIAPLTVVLFAVLGSFCSYFFVARPLISLIREQNRLEEEIRRLHANLQAIMNAVASPVFVKDEEHRFIEVNDAFCEFIGHSREELLGKTDSDFSPPAEAKAFLERDAEVFKTGQPNTQEEIHTNHQGILRVIVTKKTLHVNGDGRRFIVGVISDITERKNMEDALRESERHFRAIAEESPEIIMLTDSRGKANYVSPAVVEKLGYDVEAFKAAPLAEVVHSEDLERVQETIAANLSGEPTNIEVRLRHQDGSYRFFEASATPLARDGQVPEVLVMLRDITERKKIVELERQQYLAIRLNELVSIVVHDINNAITALGFLDLAETVLDELLTYGQKQADKWRNVGDYLNRIRSVGQEIAKQMQILMIAFSKANLTIERIDLSRTLTEVIRSRQTEGRFPGVTFTQTGMDSSVYVMGEPKWLKRVFENIIDNGAEAIPGKGNVDVEVSPEPVDGSDIPKDIDQPGSTESGRKYIRVTVRDNGSGISSENLPHIFDLFSSKARGPRHANTTHLLSLHRKAVEALGGYMGVESTMGVGTTFAVFLPAAEQPKAETKSLAPIRGGTETIWLVDDEEIPRDAVAELLRSFGYAVTTFDSPAAAQRAAALAESQPALVLTDMQMPDPVSGELSEKAGPNMFQNLQRIFMERFSFAPPLAGIMMSGKVLPDVVLRGREMGLSEFLHKDSMSLNRLGRAVRDAIDASKLPATTKPAAAAGEVPFDPSFPVPQSVRDIQRVAVLDDEAFTAELIARTIRKILQAENPQVQLITASGKATVEDLLNNESSPPDVVFLDRNMLPIQVNALEVARTISQRFPLTLIVGCSGAPLDHDDFWSAVDVEVPKDPETEVRNINFSAAFHGRILEELQQLRKLSREQYDAKKMSRRSELRQVATSEVVRPSLDGILRTAVQIMGKILPVQISGSPRGWERIAPRLFPERYRTGFAASGRVATEWPVFSQITARPEGATAGRQVIVQRQGVPEAASLLPLMRFARDNPKSNVVLALIAEAGQVDVFTKQLAALEPEGSLPGNFTVHAFAAAADFVSEFVVRFYNPAIGKPMALVTDLESSEVTASSLLQSLRGLLKVIGHPDPLTQTASALLAADKILGEIPVGLFIDINRLDQEGRLGILTAELTNYLANYSSLAASA